MNLYSVPSALYQNLVAQQHDTLDPFCSVCNQPVQLEHANTDERGLAVHEACYLRKLEQQKRAGSVALSATTARLHDFRPEVRA